MVRGAARERRSSSRNNSGTRPISRGDPAGFSRYTEWFARALLERNLGLQPVACSIRAVVMRSGDRGPAGRPLASPGSPVCRVGQDQPHDLAIGQRPRSADVVDCTLAAVVQAAQMARQ